MSAPKIAVSAISFHEKLFAGQLCQTDIPARVNSLGFDSVELLDLLAVPLPFGKWTGRVRHGYYWVKRWMPGGARATRPIKPKTYPPTVGRDLRAIAETSGVQVVSWTLDTDLTVEGKRREQERAYWQRGIATARLLGANILRVTTGGQPDNLMLGIARQNLQALVDAAAGLQVVIENHGGISSEPDLLVALLQAVPNAGCCLDFGNYPASVRHRAIQTLAPYTRHVHAKSYAFDAQGNETTIDYPAFIALLRASNYQGYYSIEYEGRGDPDPSICQTAALIKSLYL